MQDCSHDDATRWHPLLLPRVEHEERMLLDNVNEGEVDFELAASDVQHSLLQRLDMLVAEVLEAVDDDADRIPRAPCHVGPHSLERADRAVDDCVLVVIVLDRLRRLREPVPTVAAEGRRQANDPLAITELTRAEVGAAQAEDELVLLGLRLKQPGHAAELGEVHERRHLLRVPERPGRDENRVAEAEPAEGDGQVHREGVSG